jgi:hypothetical protein
MGLYDKLKKVHEQEDKLFYSDVKVDASFVGKSDKLLDVVDRTVRVEYQIEIEYRDFGVKDINVYPEGEVEIAVEVSDEQDNKTSMNIKVDMSKVRVEWQAGSGIQPLSLDIYVNENGEVDYERSYIAFTYHNPAGA